MKTLHFITIFFCSLALGYSAYQSNWLGVVVNIGAIIVNYVCWRRSVAGFLRPILKALCSLTAPKFLGPYGMDIGGVFPMPWEEDARWEAPSKLHLWLVQILRKYS